MTYKYKVIRDRILETALKSPHDVLPSEHEICRLFGVSRTTAIKALNSLKEAKLVRREVGRGTFLNRKRLQTNLHLLIDRSVPELVSFVKDIALQLSDIHPDLSLQIHPIDTTEWVREIAVRPGTKIICCSHTGFLSRMGMLLPLHTLPYFNHVLETIGPNLITWREQPEGILKCDAIPYLLTPDAMAINRTIGRDLGLNMDQGPRSWKEMAQWASTAIGYQRHGHLVMGAPIKRNHMLPLSYLLSLHGGRTFLQGSGGNTCFIFDRGEEWITYFRELHQSGAMPLYTANRPNPIFFGISFLAPWVSSWIIGQKRHFNCHEDIAIHPIPPPEDGQMSHAMIGRSEVAIIKNEKPNPVEEEAAWRVVRFLTSDQSAQSVLTTHFSCLSVHRKVFEKQSLDPEYAPFARALTRGVTRNDHPLQHQIMRILYRYFYPSVLGELPAKEAARKIRLAAEAQLDLLRTDGAFKSTS